MLLINVPCARYSRCGSPCRAGIPDEMPDAAEQVMDQRPGITKQDQPADDRRQEARTPRERLRIGCGGDQPPGEQQRAEVEHHAGDAMETRHQHPRISFGRLADAVTKAAAPRMQSDGNWLRPFWSPSFGWSAASVIQYRTKRNAFAVRGGDLRQAHTYGLSGSIASFLERGVWRGSCSSTVASLPRPPMHAVGECAARRRRFGSGGKRRSYLPSAAITRFTASGESHCAGPAMVPSAQPCGSRRSVVGRPTTLPACFSRSKTSALGSA